MQTHVALEPHTSGAHWLSERHATHWWLAGSQYGVPRSMSSGEPQSWSVQHPEGHAVQARDAGSQYVAPGLVHSVLVEHAQTWLVASQEELAGRLAAAG